MKGIGIVFAGGGGKGAYQIGVWKYLHEYGLDQYVRGVSGTSVGALNACLLTAGSYENAERLWRNVEPGQILSPRKFSPAEVLTWLGSIGVGVAAAAVGVPSVAAVGAGSLSPLAGAISMMLGRRYAFSRDGLLELMRDNVDFSLLQGAPYPCFATCLAVPQCKIRRFDLRNFSAEDAQTILLASSAIPLIFDAVEFQGETYYDGGIPMVGDNVPVDPLYEHGIEYIVVVHLSRDALVDRSAYPNSKIIEVVPSRDLGGPVDGTLDFTARGAEWRIKLGYQDAKHIFDPFVQQIILQSVNERVFQQAMERQRQFDSGHQKHAERMAESRRRMKEDGFDELYQKMIGEEN